MQPEVPVVLFDEGVPFIACQHIPDRCALSLRSVDHGVRFAGGNPRVILSLNNQQRLFDLPYVVERRSPLHKRFDLRVSLIAEFRPPQLTPPSFGAFDKRRQVCRSRIRNCAPDAVVVFRRHGKRHITAIARPLHKNAISIEVGLFLDPVEQSADVLYRIFALRAIVEIEEFLSIPRRAAHVGVNLHDAKFIDERDDIAEYIRGLPADQPLNEGEIKAGYDAFKAEKKATELTNIAIEHGLEVAALQGFVDEIIRRHIFDGDALSDLMAPLGLSWKARTQKELALMDALTPLLHRLAEGREISGLSAYEQ